MFNHLVGNTQVWVIEYIVNQTTHYLTEIDDNGTAYWSKKLGRAKTYQQKEHVKTAWKSINERGRPIQHRLAKIMADRTVVSKKS